MRPKRSMVAATSAATARSSETSVTMLATELAPLRGPIPEEQRRGGGSDDIGDISWNVPTVYLSYPANIPNLPGHSWPSAVAMATPIAHKGSTAGAKVQAMTILDLMLRPEKIQEAWDYFRNVQTKDQKYIPFIGSNDKPATHLNTATLAQYRPEIQKPARYGLRVAFWRCGRHDDRGDH